MNKNAIKKFAIKARTDLISLVQTKASLYGITEENYKEIDEHATTVNDKILTSDQQHQRSELLKQMRAKDFTQVIEEVAYTWFNRFCALRFMEVNGYLPSRLRVFTDEDNNFKPQILAEAINLDSVFAHIDMQKVFTYKQNSQDEDLFKYLLILQCNELNTILPKMFQPIEDYTELLLPDNLLRADSVVGQMVALIPQEDWQEQVQIIGWLYQYYNTEPKDQVFANLKKNIKITKENIPAATQLFTPDWIVRYMVENSLGRLWLEGHKNEDLQAKWQYYLPEVKQSEAVENELAKIRSEYEKLNPTDIKCIDPCMGSGHILCYMFDVLMQIYESYGYTPREAVKNIIEQNIYGLDIDDRAGQLAYFSLMMKARQYDRRFFRQKLKPNVMAIKDSNKINQEHLNYFGKNLAEKQHQTAIHEIQDIIEKFTDAKEYGSIIEIPNYDWQNLNTFIDDLDLVHISFDAIGVDTTQKELKRLVKQAEILARKYDVVVTNPPYMNASNMNATLSKFIKKKYADYKSDFFSAFMIRCSTMGKKYAQLGFLTPYVWMFISSYEKLREFICKQKTIESLIQFEYSAFEEATVPICTFTFSNVHINKIGAYIRLTDFKGGMEVQKEKTLEAVAKPKCGYYFEQSADNFTKIPGSPIAYWVSKNLIKDFDNQKIGEIVSAKVGLQTADNNRFLRLWSEVNISKINFFAKNIEEAKASKNKWFPYNKGGMFRRWYGNNDYVVNWENDGFEIKHFVDNKGKPRSVCRNPNFYFKKAITWSDITSGSFSCRYRELGSIHDVTGMSAFSDDDNKLYYLMGLLNTKVADYIFSILNPTLHLQIGNFINFPVIFSEKYEKGIISLVKDNIANSELDWDGFETSWDFKSSPLINGNNSLQSAYEEYKRKTNESFAKLKANEEELNKIFIDIYGLQDELSPEVEDKDITVACIYDNKADIPEGMKNNKYVLTKQDVVKQFISYAVGCMFGRYSLDKQGLAFAGGEFNLANYQTFLPDTDNIIPISDDEYFKDDIVDRFIKFLQTVYGEQNLEDNLNFIANALDTKTPPRQTIRNYFIKDFYKDHLATYKKTPIYWLFDAGKKNSFKALIYIHRYTKEQIARIRTDYIFEQQSRYRFALENNEKRLNLSENKSEKIKLDKTIKKLKDQSTELHTYEEKIHHLADQMIQIDLDNGIKHNYTIFKDVLAKLK